MNFNPWPQRILAAMILVSILGICVYKKARPSPAPMVSFKPNITSTIDSLQYYAIILLRCERERAWLKKNPEKVLYNYHFHEGGLAVCFTDAEIEAKLREIGQWGRFLKLREAEEKEETNER